MIRLVDVLKAVCPKARPEYLQAFDLGGAWLTKEGITTSTELAPFLATILEETGGLTVTWEDLNYTHAARIREVWPSRFATDADAQAFVGQPEKLGNYVYANRMGNGGIASGDGFRYRGCGLGQTTGKADHAAAGAYAGADFLNNPELMLTAEWALAPVVWEWGRSNLNSLAKAGDFKGITRIWNGGYTNMDERERWLAIMHQHLDGQTIDLSAPIVAPPTSVPAPSLNPKEVQMSVLPDLKLPAVPMPALHPLDAGAVLAGAASVAAIPHAFDGVPPVLLGVIAVVAVVVIWVVWCAFRHKVSTPAKTPVATIPAPAAAVVAPAPANSPAAVVSTSIAAPIAAAPVPVKG